MIKMSVYTEEGHLEHEERLQEVLKKNGKLAYHLVQSTVHPILGVIAGGIARSVGHPELIAALPIIELVTGEVDFKYSSGVKNFVKNYAKYCVGAALTYSDKIYQVAQEHLPEIYQTAQSLIDKL